MVVPPDAEYPFKRDIEKGKYDKAYDKIKRRISRDSNNLECHYAAFRLYCTDGFPQRNLDSAYHHLARVRMLYAKADEKELERWARDSYSGARIDYDLYELATLAIADAHAIRTPDAYQHILNAYPLFARELKDSVTHSRDSLEFDIARRAGTIATLQDFIDRRPDALVRNDAVRMRDSLAFAEADAQHTYTSYQHFRVTYPQSHLFDRATDSVYAIDYRDVARHNTEQYYRGYAERYPASPYAERCLWLADSIEYKREVDSTDWQSILHYLDSRNRPHWKDTAALCLARFALQNRHVAAARHAVRHCTTDEPLCVRLASLLHDAYLHTSILNYTSFYQYPFAKLVPDHQREKDSTAYHFYLSHNTTDIDSCIRLTAPSHEAYTLLQHLIKDDLDRQRWAVALATVKQYANEFSDDYNYRRLTATLETRSAPSIKNAVPASKSDKMAYRSLTPGPAAKPAFNSGSLVPLDTMTAPGGHIVIFSSKAATEQEVSNSTNLYVTILDDDGHWSSPISLGNQINTSCDERSPYLHPDMRTLYFSSEGHGALGGMDIFMSTRLDDSWIRWSEPVSIGRDLNGTHDEWACRISDDGKKAFFVRNDNNIAALYSATLPQPVRPQPVSTISGTVKDSEGNPVYTSIRWQHPTRQQPQGECFTNPLNGSFSIVLPQGSIYSLYVHDNLRFPSSYIIEVSNTKENLQLIADRCDLARGDSLIVTLHGIDFSPANPQPDSNSTAELLRIVHLVKQRNLRVVVECHTDGNPGDADNLQLSQLRAEYLRDMMIENGCRPSAISAIGYGSDRPLPHNKNDRTRPQQRRTVLRLYMN